MIEITRNLSDREGARRSPEDFTASRAPARRGRDFREAAPRPIPARRVCGRLYRGAADPAGKGRSPRRAHRADEGAAAPARDHEFSPGGVCRRNRRGRRGGAGFFNLVATPPAARGHVAACRVAGAGRDRRAVRRGRPPFESLDRRGPDRSGGSRPPAAGGSAAARDPNPHLRGPGKLRELRRPGSRRGLEVERRSQWQSQI